jgi:hypothetical protein
VEKIKLTKNQEGQLNFLLEKNKVLHDAVLDHIADKQREKRRPSLNKLGRAHIRSNAYKIIINEDKFRKWEYTEFSKYIEQRESMKFEELSEVFD